MPSRTFIAREEKLMPGFKTSKDSRLTLLRANAAGNLSWSQCSLTILKTLGPFKMMLNLLYLCSINRITKPGWQHICSQHSWLNILSPLLRPTAQKKKIPFKILLLIDNVLLNPRALMEMYNKISVVFMSTITTSILQPIDQKSFQFSSLTI